ncbi:DUF1858 domain-containing protein [Limosilactobacillus mucosae]|uniref:DUF1858 domain-containing protein n=1 Tax=Limosilactobacillus mucosae TaxID=97478 RepID=A0AAJ1HVH6_LIMMU|nr:DUF1858 domain-containing protein [Limosilactobacillus mucosae]MDC2830151.1 DUF1858 domain-containing protein [Limosilactobacillus mucosae]MDC2837609.1 DUF1858 domain-containing protein [Limosilactobacillus mucosae]MDC2849619.1 DUF1858 domain-containing protein [Limosilactobacillus mucosae]MDC2853876.1 DUF1858 domain-containing protein [Limosilactobacillus mucosae]
MNEKTVDFNVPVQQLAKQDKEFVSIMVEAGFDKIKIPGMLETVGRFVTINRGCLAMNIEKQHVINVFKAYGYEVINND